MRLLSILVLVVPAIAAAGEYRVYLLGGQSNMDGFGYVDELPSGYRKPSSDVLIFHGNPAADGEPGGDGRWSVLQPGHGIGFAASELGNDYSERFGPELSLGYRLHAPYPDSRIALIWHYDSPGSIAMGIDFAEKLAALDALRTSVTAGRGGRLVAFVAVVLDPEPRDR